MMVATAVFALGLTLLAVGVGMVYVPAALMVAGAVLAAGAVLYVRGELRARRRGG